MNEKRYGDWRDEVWTGEEILRGEPALRADLVENELRPRSQPIGSTDWTELGSWLTVLVMLVGAPFALVQALALLTEFDNAFILRPTFWLVAAAYVTGSLGITQTKRFERYVWLLTGALVVSPVLLTLIQRAIFGGVGLGASIEVYAWTLFVPVLGFHLVCLWRRGLRPPRRPRRRRRRMVRAVDEPT